MPRLSHWHHVPNITEYTADVKMSLAEQFQAAEDVLATSEAESPHHPVSTGSSSSLLNSDNSPYGCDETVTSLGTKYWGYQPGSGPTLEDLVIEQLPIPLRARYRRFLPWDDPPALLDKLADQGLVTKKILGLFRALGIVALDLTGSLGGRDPINTSRIKLLSTLQVFKMPHSFRDLRELSLHRVMLRNDDVLCLASLRLERLDLGSTGIATEATAHLVSLKSTLRGLDLSNNPKVKQWACYNLACLEKLDDLRLDGTNVQMTSLRYLCAKWPEFKCLYLTVPFNCRKFLDTLGERYHAIIPEPYLSAYDAEAFSTLWGSVVLDNLAFHRKKDKTISTKGGLATLLRTLKKHLKKRDADFRIKNWLKAPAGQNHEAVV